MSILTSPSRKKRTSTGDIVDSSYHYITNRDYHPIHTFNLTLRTPRICNRVA